MSRAANTDVLSQIDSILAAHEVGGTFPDGLSRDAMRWTTDPDAVPPASADHPFADAEIIDSYSRAQMLADGDLVDVTAMAREAGFRFPVAVTRAVWEDCVAWTDADDQRAGVCQDQDGRLWDVLWMTMVAIRRSPDNTSRIRVQLLRVPRVGAARHPRPVELAAVCGPGDAAEPVITIMQLDED